MQISSDVITNLILSIVIALLAVTGLYAEDKFYNLQYDKMVYIKFAGVVLVSAFIGLFARSTISNLFSSLLGGGGNNPATVTSMQVGGGTSTPNLKFNSGMPNF